MNFKDFLAAMQALEGNRNITKEIVLEALNEALVKAYRKHIEIPDALVKVEIDQNTGEVNLFQPQLYLPNSSPSYFKESLYHLVIGILPNQAFIIVNLSFLDCFILVSNSAISNCLFLCIGLFLTFSHSRFNLCNIS